MAACVDTSVEPTRGVEPLSSLYESVALPLSYAGVTVCGPERLRSSDLPLAGRALSWLSYGPRDGVAGTTQTCVLWLRRPALSSLSYGDMGGRTGVEPVSHVPQTCALPLS